MAINAELFGAGTSKPKPNLKEMTANCKNTQFADEIAVAAIKIAAGMFANSNYTLHNDRERIVRLSVQVVVEIIAASIEAANEQADLV